MHSHSLTALFTVIYVKQSDAIAICNWQNLFSPLLQAEDPRQYLKQMKMKTCYSNRRNLEVNNVTVVFCAEMYNTVIFWIVTTIKIKHQLASFTGSFENDQAVQLEMASNTVFCVWVPVACGWHEIHRSVDSELHVKCWTLDCTCTIQVALGELGQIQSTFLSFLIHKMCTYYVLQYQSR